MPKSCVSICGSGLQFIHDDRMHIVDGIIVFRRSDSDSNDSKWELVGLGDEGPDDTIYRLEDLGRGSDGKDLVYVEVSIGVVEVSLISTYTMKKIPLGWGIGIYHDPFRTYVLRHSLMDLPTWAVIQERTHEHLEYVEIGVRSTSCTGFNGRIVSIWDYKALICEKRIGEISGRIAIYDMRADCVCYRRAMSGVIMANFIAENVVQIDCMDDHKNSWIFLNLTDGTEYVI